MSVFDIIVLVSLSYQRLKATDLTLYSFTFSVMDNPLVARNQPPKQLNFNLINCLRRPCIGEQHWASFVGKGSVKEFFQEVLFDIIQLFCWL